MKVNYPKAVLVKEEYDQAGTIELKRSEINSPSTSCWIPLKSTGSLRYLGLSLGNRYDWKIVKDSQEELVLLAFKKGIK